MDSFEHDPLDLTKPGIRLLRLLKGCTGPIRCELFEVDVAERSCEPPYEALSYVWGSSDLTHHIEISGKELRITASLHLALSHLRLADDRVLWVDAVCINQNNHKERGHQVQRMGDIYSQARQVIVWLGQSTDNTDAFMNAMQRLQAEMERPGSPYRNWVPHYTDDMDWPGKWHHRWRKHVKDEFSHLMEYKDGTSYTDSDSYEYGIGYSSERRPDTDFTSARDGLIDLLHRAWFRRIWILQEVANASALIFHCGRFSIPALYFTVGPEIINSYRGHGVILNGQCQAVIDIMPTHRLTSNSWWERGRTMYSLLKHFCQSQATDPRDMIYALRGISTDITKCGFPTVDYEVSEEVLAKRMSYFMFHCDLTSWARLDTISDLIAQLDWLLAASVTVHSGSSQDADLSQLLDNGYIRITSYIMQVPFESGHWVLIDRLLSRPKTSISTEAATFHFLEMGADPEMTSIGRTPVMLAAMYPHNGIGEVVSSLLKCNADVSKIVENETAMSLAKKHGNNEVMRLLSEWIPSEVRSKKRKWRA
ncbi:ankyrin repeat and sam domain containing protein 6 [Colletotrichum chrysophilum]|uniref:Ankyrin repeat and sam domain containing protein 6 n=1 Tax=Colletotrichum chrysophilum TaxID=1836956 RepID=A0AAD9AD90_9PEZI|nr:ankyrin repeat and sam domain containing protein 6 [Colletotrichum chrysophilum]